MEPESFGSGLLWHIHDSADERRDAIDLGSVQTSTWISANYRNEHINNYLPCSMAEVFKIDRPISSPDFIIFVPTSCIVRIPVLINTYDSGYYL